MEVALESGADDVITTSHGYEVRCNIHLFDKLAHALSKAGVQADSAELAYIPLSTVPVPDETTAQSIIKLHDALEELDDVQAVFSNEDID